MTRRIEYFSPFEREILLLSEYRVGPDKKRCVAAVERETPDYIDSYDVDSRVISRK